MLWWQILLLVFCSLIVLAAVCVSGMYFALRLMLSIFLNDENYAKWITAGAKMKKLLRLKGLSGNTELEDIANGGY
jgi:hypothetical protein